jgi:hypothetical protein
MKLAMNIVTNLVELLVVVAGIALIIAAAVFNS